MNKHSRLGTRVRGTLLPLAIATGLLVTMAPADAAARKIGPVKNLAVAVTKPTTSYRLASTWDALTGATAYKVSLTGPSGGVLASGSITATQWTPTTTLGAGSTVTVKVVPMAGNRPGRPTTKAVTLPDLTAPQGAYTVTQATPGAATVSLDQTALSDDVTPAADVTRTVAWGDGSTEQLASGVTTADHTYAIDLARYSPTVTLVDLAGNSRVVPLRVVVVGDKTVPAGQFAVTRTAWAKYTRVRLTETSVTDNYSVPANVRRVVNWNDGSPTASWTGTTGPSHVYTVAGSYAPTVQLVDEAGNTAAAAMANGVTVKADTVAPKATLVRPRTRSVWVSSWVRVRGRATDTAGTGVNRVRLRVIEKRGATWYAYRGTTRTWVRGGSTQASALRRTTLAQVRPTATHTWTYRFSGLRKGVLVVSVSATDKVNNVSRALTYKQSLTHR